MNQYLNNINDSPNVKKTFPIHMTDDKVEKYVIYMYTVIFFLFIYSLSEWLKCILIRVRLSFSLMQMLIY